MKTILLASTALFFVLASQAGATAPMGEATLQLDTAKLATVQLADNGNGHSGGSDDDGGSDDHGGNSVHGGSNHSDDDDNGHGSDHDANDDNSSSSSSDDNSNSTSTSNSNRKKKRVRGGSGCDSAGDIAEHAECRG